MSELAKPKTLFKFRSWDDDYHKTLLTERKLWVPTATDLNDPFDCSIPFRYDLMSEDDLRKRLHRLHKQQYPDMPRDQRRRIVNGAIKNRGIRYPRRKGGFLKESLLNYRNQHGILSFSTIREVPLLWSHYSDAYRGFCVGLDFFLFTGIVQEYFKRTGESYQEAWVKYEKTFPEVIPSEVLDDDEDLEKFLQLFTTKSEHWGHEEEYRYVFAATEGFPLILTPQCVTEVILGSEMPEAHKKEVAKVVAEQFPSAQLLQAGRKFDSYELEFV